MRGATRASLQLQQVLRLPRKMTLVITPLHTWNAIYNARRNKCHCPNSPNTAPATKNESHDWSLSHMKRYLQCAEQQVSLSKLTKYCACHAKWLSKISQKFLENSWNVISNAGPIRPWSDHDPTMKPSLRNPPRKRGYFSRSPRAFSIEKYNISRSGYHSKFHRILRLPRKVTVQHHQILRLPRKVTLERHQIVHLPRKVTLELHQTVHLPRKVTLRYSTLLFSTIRCYSLTNLISDESIPLRISSQTNLFSNESNLLRISSHTNLISYESLLKRI